MLWIIPMAIIGLAAGVARAEDPYVAKNLFVTNPSAHSFYVYPNNAPAAVISPGGEVRIDWKIVEKLSKGGVSRGMHVGVARALLAVRDGTWKPMEGPKP